MVLIRVHDPKAREIIYTHIQVLGLDIGGVRTKAIPYTEEDDPRVESFQFFEVEEKRVEAVLNHLTTVFPGRDICVYTMTESAVRPAGEIVRKKVTKEGVLPF